MNESKKPYASVGGTELSLWDITKILLAKIHWLLLAGVVVAAGVYAVVTIFVTPTYESRVSFYVYNSAGNQGSSEEHTETITRYTLDGKSQERVVEWNTVSGAIHSVKNYGNTMFFLLSGLTINKNESGQEWTYT